MSDNSGFSVFGTSVEKEASVIDVRSDHYGCQFSNKDYEKELGFYLQT